MAETAGSYGVDMGFVSRFYSKKIKMNTSNLCGISLIVMGFLMTGCSGDENTGNCGEEKEVVVELTAEDFKDFPDSLPAGFGSSLWRTTFPSTNFYIRFNNIEGICLEAPVHFFFEASCHQVPYEGDVTISGIAGSGGGSFGLDLNFVSETTEEIRFSKDTILVLGTIDFLGEVPFFYSGVKIEVRTGGTAEDDLAYLCQVFNQIKVTATYKALRK